MSVQYILSDVNANLTTGTRYSGITNARWLIDGVQGSEPWMAAGVFSNMKITLPSAPGVGTSRTFTLEINSVATGLTLTFSDAETDKSITGVTAAVASFDIVRLVATNVGTPADVSNVHLALEFRPTVDGTQSFGSMCSGQVPVGTTYNGVFAGNFDWTTTLSDAVINVVPVAGTITGGGIKLSVATGAAKSRTVTLYKNGVKQDGTGGTVNTQLTVTDGTQVTGSFSLPVAAGDLVYSEHVPTNSPATARVLYGYSFVATNPLQCALCGNLGAVSAASTVFAFPSGVTQVTSTTESARQRPGAITAFTASALYWSLGAAPGGATSRTVTLRKAAGNTSLTSTISDANTTGNDAHNVALEAADLWDLQFARSGAVAATGAGWGLVLTTSVRKVPNVVGLQRAAAVASVQAKGLIAQVTERFNPVVPVDDVIETDPPADTEVPEGSTVEVVVSLGPGGGGVGSGGARYASRYRGGWEY